jgi:uncharacterized damage-inducible protein DinB
VDLRFLFDYTRWADARMFEAVAKLPPEAWTKEAGGSFKSLRDTVVHLVSAQWIWLSRWKGISPKAMWDPAEFPTPSSVRAKGEPLAKELSDFAAAQTPESLAREVSYTNLAGKTLAWPLGPLMLHMVNHSTYHRGQVTTLLRQLGATPVGTDLVVYLGERR